MIPGSNVFYQKEAYMSMADLSQKRVSNSSLGSIGRGADGGSRLIGSLSNKQMKVDRRREL
jgi:hypothetical protein